MNKRYNLETEENYNHAYRYKCPHECISYAPQYPYFYNQNSEYPSHYETDYCHPYNFMKNSDYPFNFVYYPPNEKKRCSKKACANSCGVSAVRLASLIEPLLRAIYKKIEFPLNDLKMLFREIIACTKSFKL